MWESLTKQSNEIQLNSAFYKEVIINAQRAYTGEHMKAVYTDGGRSQYFNVENLALKYYG